MHVGGLQLITPPPDAPPDFVQRMRSGSAIRPRPCRPSTSARCSASAWFWTCVTHDIALMHFVVEAIEEKLGRKPTPKKGTV